MKFGSHLREGWRHLSEPPAGAGQARALSALMASADSPTPMALAMARVYRGHVHLRKSFGGQAQSNSLGKALGR